MNNRSILGLQVKVRANDFIRYDVPSRIVSLDEGKRTLLLLLNSPIEICGTTFTHAVASPRLARDEITFLLETQILGCSVVFIPQGRLNPSQPFDTSWWRGGGAVVTDVTTDERPVL